MSDTGDTALGAALNQIVIHGEKSTNGVGNTSSPVAGASMSFEKTADRSRIDGPRPSPFLFNEEERDGSPDSYVPAPPANDPTGAYTKAYAGRLGRNASVEAGPSKVTRAPVARMFSQDSPTTPLIAPKRGRPNSSKKPRSTYNQYGLEDDETYSGSREYQQGSPARKYKNVVEEPYNYPARRRSAESEVNDYTPSFSGPLDEDQYEDHEMRDGLEGDQYLTRSANRHNGRLNFQGSPQRQSSSSAGNYFQGDENEDGQENNEEGLFVTNDLSPNAQSQAGSSLRFDHGHFIKLKEVANTPVATKPGPSRKRKASPEPEERFNNIGRNLAPSRYSGTKLPWGMNQDPPLVRQAEVSDAALLKRGLKRGKEDKVCKRGYGANDPENIAIVNMRETDRLSFPQIVDILNQKRIENGADPDLSVCGVTSRYSRTAPLLFAAEGKQFVPLSKRGKRGATMADLELEALPVRPQWNNETDLLLVKIYKEDEKDRWSRIAEEFNKRSGPNVRPIDPAAAARRHTML
ncbi:hypothetical protein LZ554_002104 [Drepanopeziza brunnea f. sp. 'monogermtubi']|nr:hypothetical protein LZ554_002104 [Drepanopeziza brunnea f. sp. 'monogermtubi']